MKTHAATTSSAVSRRAFLRAAGATSLAAFAAPYVHAQDKSGLARPMLGAGEHTYECIHDWLAPPTDVLWGDTHGLAQDTAGRMYVAHTVHAESAKPHAVAVFDRD